MFWAGLLKSKTNNPKNKEIIKHLVILINETQPESSNSGVCATSKASDQPAHTRRMIIAFASCLNILWLLSYWLNTVWNF